MKHKTFFWFILPSALAMILFIALPIISVVMQSVFAPHEQVIRSVENCGVFGCTTSTIVDLAATAELASLWGALSGWISLPIVAIWPPAKSPRSGLMPLVSAILWRAC
jgi:ABC-type sulfate transport system permease component